MSRVVVPRAVYDGLEAVQLGGQTSMLDRPRGAELADELGHQEAAAWVREDRGRYARAVFAGIRPDDEAEPAVDAVAAALEQIAREELGIEALEVRGRHRLDFHDVGGAGLRRALERTFELGRIAAP